MNTVLQCRHVARGRERRRDARVQVDLPAELRVEDELIPATVVDISMSGALLSARSAPKFRLQKDMRLTLRVWPPHVHTTTIIKARVVRATSEDNHHSIAVFFVDIEPAAQSGIERLLLDVLTGVARPDGDLHGAPTVEVEGNGIT